jgi:hypothetical protein
MRFSRVALVLASAVMWTPGIQPLAAERVEVKLQGSAYLDEEACAKGTAADGCRLNFEVTGKTAKLIYDGMTAEGSSRNALAKLKSSTRVECIVSRAKRRRTTIATLPIPSMKASLAAAVMAVERP